MIRRNARVHRVVDWICLALSVIGSVVLPRPAAALSLTDVTSDNGLPARAIAWTDANGQPRSAVMVDQRAQGAGYLRQFVYRWNGMDRLCRGTGDNGHQGDGYVQNHTAAGGDSSSHNTPGTTTVLLQGPHHALISYDMPGYQISGQSVPTTVQWLFTDGRSDPLFIITQDARGTAGNLGADSRSPYGDVAYDGGAGTAVGGASFGDTYKFTTLAANPEQVTRASGWRYTERNTIPYAMQWSDPAQADAEMGHVATVPITVQDQGSDPRTFPTVDIRGKEDLDGPMIDDENWAYQILNYVFPGQGPTGSKRLTWGTNWGLPGGFNNFGDPALDPKEYSQHATSANGAYNGTRANGMLMAYSVFVVLGPHLGNFKDGAVGQVVRQMENAARAQLVATTGSVRPSGPAGVGPAVSATVAYQPAGYNPTYATWELTASQNAVDATLTPAAGDALDHPVFVVHDYTLAQLPATISVGDGLAAADADFYATLDTSNRRLWITVNAVVVAPLRLKVSSGGGAPQAPTIAALPGSGTEGAAIVITGSNFSGATAVRFNGLNAAFTVDSPTQITATVPIGATPGPVTVTTPTGTATSALTFTPNRPGGSLASGTFQQLDSDGGGWFTGFAIHASGRLYGRTDVGGLYRSDDHGDTWSYLSGDFTSYTGHCVQGVAAASANPDVVYQCVGFAFGGSEQGIWKTTDGGVSWRQVKPALRFSGNDPERWGGECIAIRPGADSDVWAGSRGDGLWRSPDAGTTWTQVGAASFADAQFTSISLPPVGRRDLWVGASGFGGPGGVWVSVDEGISWKRLAGAQAGVGAPDGCWRITRDPSGKVLVAGGNGVLGSVLYEFSAADWNNPDTYSWKDISWPGIDRSQAAPLVAALADGRIIAGSIFGGYNGGPDSLRTQIRSEAGNWTPTDALNGVMPAWQRQPPPVLIEGGRNALVQDPTNPNRWFLAGGYGPFRTTDAGRTWQYIVNGIDEVVAYKVNFHPTDPNRVYIPMADHGGAVVLDGGTSGSISRYITTRTLPYPDDLGLCRALLASADRVLALGTDERNNWRPRIFASMDNGLTWKVLAVTGFPNQDNRPIVSAAAARDNADEVLVALGGLTDAADGGVYRSTDAAATFTRSTGLPAGVDYGDQWNPNADLAVDAADPNVRYLFLKSRGLYRSNDRGASWSFLNTGLPNYAVMAADASLGKHLWVGTCCQQPVGLSRSTDGGVTWTTVSGFVNVTAVDAANDRVAVLGERAGDSYDKIYYSADAGATWDEMTRPGFRFGNAAAVAVDPWRPGTVWISTNGRSVARFTPGSNAAFGPKLTLARTVGQGVLRIVSGPGQYDREGVALDTSANDYGWIGAGSQPVTYALTIAGFPGKEYSGFQAHLFLVPNASNSSAPDYTEPDVVMLDIQDQADGSATGWFRYKLGEPNGNSQLYGAGALGRVDCPTGPLGTWSVTFVNDSSITLKAPNGVTKQFAFPDAQAVRNAFGGKIKPFFGNQANQPGQIGQMTTFSQITITGTPRALPVNETFPGPDLNQHALPVNWVWTRSGDAPAGITIQSAGEALALSWTVPDDRFIVEWTPALGRTPWTAADLGPPEAAPTSKSVRIAPSDRLSRTAAFYRMIRR